MPFSTFYLTRFLPAALFILITSDLFAQQGQKIEILRADALKVDTLHRARKLVGNVKLRQGEVIMECDSALFYSGRNAVDAFGNVFIYDPQTKVYADMLEYDGEHKIATLTGNVRVKQDSALLITDKLIYNTLLREAAYQEGGTVTAKDLIITSDRGYFYSVTKEARFGGNVDAKGTDYRVVTDTLMYDTENEVTYFFAPTVITREKEKIYCEEGHHDTRTEISVFGKNTLMESEAQKIWSDSLYYNSRLGFGISYDNFRWTDTTMNAILSGNHAVYFSEMQRITATDSALLIYLVDNDSLFLSADTLKSREDTVNKCTEFFAYPDVRIFKKNLQGVCDSLSFSFHDSIIMMYKYPVLWSDENQMTGDTIAILMNNGKLDRIEMFNNGFIANQAHENGLFNQIKGRRIYGYFKERQLDRLLAEGNGESIYYGKDDNNAFIGVNKALCSNMWIYLDNERVSRIKFLTQPEAVFYPIQPNTAAEFLLKGFSWQAELRPKSKYDLFRKTEPVK